MNIYWIGFKKWKLTHLFNKVKYTDIAKMLLPTNSCLNFDMQMIPEHFLEKSLDPTWNLQYVKSSLARVQTASQ